MEKAQSLHRQGEVPARIWLARFSIEFLTRFQDLGWAKHEEGSRMIAFSPSGEKRFLDAFPL